MTTDRIASRGSSEPRKNAEDRSKIGNSPATVRFHLAAFSAACFRYQAPSGDRSFGLGATSLATVLQMVANGYGITLLPQVAIDAEARDRRVKLLRFAPPVPKRSIGLAWRPSSPRRSDFVALGRIMVDALATRGAATLAPATAKAVRRRAGRRPK